MNTIKTTIENFDSKIAQAHHQMQHIICKITDADQQIRQYLQEYRASIQKISLVGENKYERELASLLADYKRQSNDWCDSISSFIEGREFINQFEKSILVVVFGNVNVGKSSVGNLIAGVTDGDNRNDNELQQHLLEYFGSPPEFFEYDLADGSKEYGPRTAELARFREGYVETTANIQYFTRKDGLTWTDSPGICSVTKENGDLARKYVEFADLVIFITTSSSPAKFDEIQELKKLFCQKKKPMLLLINKSDRTEKDEIDGAIVKILREKSKEDRNKQENYAKEAFRLESGEMASELDAISVSTHLALKAIKKQDDNLFELSGYPIFLNKLGELCSEKAVELKMNTPKCRVQAMINELIEGDSLARNGIMGITQQRDKLKALQEQVSETKKRIQNTAQDAISQIVSQSMGEIISYVQDSARDIREGGKKNLDAKVNEIVTSQTAEVLKSAVRLVLEDYVGYSGRTSQYNGISGVQLSSKMEKVQRTVYEVKEVSRKPKGLVENIEAFLFDKKFTTTKIKTHTVTDSFANGDNSTEIIERISQSVQSTISSYVQNMILDIQNGYFAKEEQMISCMLDILEELENNLKKVSLQ